MAVILLIMPATLHRIVWAGENSEQLLRIGGGLTATALVPLALGRSGESYVVATRIVGSRTVGLTVAAASTLVLIGLWFIWPMIARWAPA